MQFATHMRQNARTLIGASLLLALGSAAHATDSYSGGVVTIPTVNVGSATLTNVTAKVASVVTAPSGTSANGTVDVYNPSNQQLTVQSVNVGGKTYYNAVAALTPASATIGGASGADTYSGGVLTIASVQVGSKIYNDVTVAVAPADILGIGGGLPAQLADTYVGGVLTIPVVEAFGRVYTNVTVAVTLADVTGIGSTSYPVVTDVLASGAAISPFGGSCTNPAFDTSTINPANGLPGYELTIPANCGGGYSGFTIVPASPTNLSAYNAVTFWAKANTSTSLDTVGLGNDGITPIQTYSAEADAQFGLTTSWQKFTIPLPDPKQATAIPGLFHLAQGTVASAVSIWVNDVQYVTLKPAPVESAATFAAFGPIALAPSSTSQFPANATVTFTAPATSESAVGAGWFAFTSTNPSVATVVGSEVTSGATTGTATLTATLEGVAVSGSSLVTVAQPQVPSTSPAKPTATAEAAVYSPTYNATAVWSYNAGFCGANTFANYQIPGGDTVLQYGLSSTAACFAWADASLGGSVGTSIDVSAFTTLHIDIWTPAAPAVIDIAPVDFTGGTGVRADYYVSYGSGVAAACQPSSWCSLEIPMNSSATGKPQWKALGQFLLVAQDTPGANIGVSDGDFTFFIDNFYFH